MCIRHSQLLSFWEASCSLDRGPNGSGREEAVEQRRKGKGNCGSRLGSSRPSRCLDCRPSGIRVLAERQKTQSRSTTAELALTRAKSRSELASEAEQLVARGTEELPRVCAGQDQVL